MRKMQTKDHEYKVTTVKIPFMSRHRSLCSNGPGQRLKTL
jgi:hypothetical protein